jgi:release factor glutamine methyltransferase
MSNYLNEITLRIKELSESPFLDAQVLLSHLAGKNRSWVLAHPEMELDEQQKEKLVFTLEQIESGVPLPYIIGNWEFYGLELIVSKDVLIPRPETELLVDKALDWIKANPQRRKLIDMGTGSGCIAVALCVNIPDLVVKAVDISEKALMIARQNAEKFNVADRIQFILEDLWGEKKRDGHFSFSSQNDRPSESGDLITANLPYIPTTVLHGLEVFGREPDLALDGGSDGLNEIRDFLRFAPLYLKPGGLVLMELEASHGLETLNLAKENFPEAKIHLYKDLSGLDRVMEIREKG